MKEKDQETSKPYWEGKAYAFFSNKKCEYFPCHEGADPDNFNCLFCYCPLYALGRDCGGNFCINEKGFKDCTNCRVPHLRENYGHITGSYLKLVERMHLMDVCEQEQKEKNREEK